MSVLRDAGLIDWSSQAPAYPSSRRALARTLSVDRSEVFEGSRTHHPPSGPGHGVHGSMTVPTPVTSSGKPMALLPFEGR
jgi:hypothetical protein